MNDVIKYRDIKQLFMMYDDVAKEYGLFSKQVTLKGPDGRAVDYLVFSVNEIGDSVNPVEIINRNNRNNNIFYPENFAVALNNDNPLLIWERITSYLTYAEMMCELYEQFDTPLPKAIRVDELTELANFYCGQYNPNYDLETRKQYIAGIREFFKNERPKSKFMKEWKEFYRSELFDEDKSFAKNFIIFLKRNEPETNISVLLDSNDALKKVYLSEHHYKEFREIIKEKYPDVKYSVGDKEVVDKGIIIDPKTGKSVTTQYGQCVTQEEYDRICDERFSIDGFECLDGLNPSYFEGRDIVYKVSDENIIASVIHDITFRWTKCPPLDFLQERGTIESIDIPVSQMKNFYVTMRQYEVPFCIDNDVNRNPNFETLRILYNTQDFDKVKNIVAGLTIAQISLAHIAYDDVSYRIDVDKIDTLLNQAKLRSESWAAAKQAVFEDNSKKPKQLDSDMTM